jgi:class 3 adenylate cyclase
LFFPWAVTAGLNTRMAVVETRFAVLLFTDIVDSTELKCMHGAPAFKDALEIHNRHFERAADECRGVEILQNTGDGYMARGDSVAEMVKLALLFQDAIRNEPWAAVRLTSRVGVHAGESYSLSAKGGCGLMGPAVDLASRLMSLAMGGQILMTLQLSHEARHFVREHPAVSGKTFPPLRWLAHGAYVLKGRDEAFEIVEVGVPGVAPLVPPPNREKGKRMPQPAVPANSPRARSATRVLCMSMGAVAAVFVLQLRKDVTAMQRDRATPTVAGSFDAPPTGNRQIAPAARETAKGDQPERRATNDEVLIPGDESARKLADLEAYRRQSEINAQANAEPGEVVSRRAGRENSFDDSEDRGSKRATSQREGRPGSGHPGASRRARTPAAPRR